MILKRLTTLWHANGCPNWTPSHQGQRQGCTQISALNHWPGLAALLDTYSCFIVGWAMSGYRDEALVEAALRMALVQRDLPQPAKLIQHTDRGSQYTADDYLALLEAHGIQMSMSNKGDPYDNAMMESFFSTLRAELTDLELFATRQAARTAVFEFIEVFYNSHRLHSSLGYCMQPIGI